MHGFKGERVLMRIHIGERDKFDGEPLYWAIVQLLRKRHYAGATVTRGIMGFGASSRIHAARFLELSLDLPIIVECVETQEKIDLVKQRMIKNYGYCEICSTDVLNFVASIFARGDAKE